MQIDYEKILEETTKRVTRDNMEHFTDTSRLDYIREQLRESDYEVLCETPLSVIYKKKNVVLPEKIVLISSHVDCVDEIKKPNFKITKKGNYKGTFDNAATNAAVLIAMLEQRLEDNVLVSFTGDEEDDSDGAKQVMKYLENLKKKVIAVTLDVTFDLETEEDEERTTYQYASYTIDNLCNNTNEKIAKNLFQTANELGIPFMVTRAYGKKDYFASGESEIPDYYDKKLEVKDPAYEDEAVIYYKNKACIASFSLCLPTDDVVEDYNMHSDELIKIKRKSFLNYIEAVIRISNKMSK